MTLSRSRPLPSHTWGDPDAQGHRHCQTEGCSATWQSQYDDPPPWSCRRSPLSPVSDSNSGRDHQRDEEFRSFVRQQPCVVCGDPPPNQACHVKNWGAGWGDWLPDGTGNLYSGCVEHHREEENELGTGPETFQAEHEISLEEEAKRIGREYREGAK